MAEESRFVEKAHKIADKIFQQPFIVVPHYLKWVDAC
jgi:hypothetical protein